MNSADAPHMIEYANKVSVNTDMTGFKQEPASIHHFTDAYYCATLHATGIGLYSA